ncbi:MAG: alpha/beta fold hydrolase [Gemmatimonadales bacterium]
MTPPSSPTALLLPGMGLNASFFPNIGLPTVFPDWGPIPLGNDGTLPSTATTRMEVYRSALDDALARSPNWRDGPRIVLAHSFGGMLALDWVLYHGCRGPARLDGLVLIGTTAGPMYETARVRLARFGRRELRLGISRFMPFWNLPATTRTVKRLFCRGSLGVCPVDFSSLGSTSDFAIDSGVWRNTDWRAMRSFRLAMQGFDVRHRLSEIDVPTIVLHGTDDPLFATQLAEDLAGGIHGAELRLIRRAGHGLPLSHPGEITRAVRDCLEFG